MKQFFQEYFYYTRKERNGAFALVVLCLLLVLAPKLYPFFLPPPPASDSRALREAAERIALSDGSEEDSDEAGPAHPAAALFPFDPNTADAGTFVRLGLSERTAQTILNYRKKGGKFFKSTDFKKIYALREADYLRLAPYIRIAGSNEYPQDQSFSTTKEKTPPAESFNFDPNTADEVTLQKLGIPEKAIRVMMNYRAKGGRFRKKEDLAKIYSLPEADYLRLESFIQIEAQPDPKTKPGSAVQPAPAAVLVDINKAGSEEWQALRGIGATIAGRIVSYREKLGGFASVEQVGEMRGLPDSVFQHIKPQLVLSPIFRPIPINSAGIDALKAHPYLSQREAEAIAAYRVNHGDFQNFEDVKKVKALSPKTLEKLKPYLQY
ncbi:MAG: helix-hairpin-helix domain-containing protein [Saprospiraceae bacterium]|nr:helix-hairpin-helix domain-containing protein [Saprospiraceae bacterium]